MKVATNTRAVSSTPSAPPGARAALLDAAQTLLRTEGVASLSTRRVAAAADQPLSQIHYHFASKQSLTLALLDYISYQTLPRPHAMSGDHTQRSWRRSHA